MRLVTGAGLLIAVGGAFALTLTAWQGGGSSTESVLEQGKKVYHARCVECHGPQGRGDGPKARELGFHPRDFTLGAFKCRCTPSGQLPTDEDLLRIVTNGMPGTPMQPHANLSLADRQAVVQYIKTLSPGFSSSPPPKCVDLPAPPQATPAAISEGRQVYRVLGCWKCHGAKGRGDGPSAADLKDDWGRPIRAYNFTAARRFKCGADDRDLYRTLVTGMNGSPMPSFEEALLFGREAVSDLTQYKGTYGAEDLAELKSYLSAQPTTSDIKDMSPSGRESLIEKRAWALVHYLKSLVLP